MCGIAGFFNYRTLAPATPGVVERMTRVMVHRGPDAEGYLVDGPVALGHRRLSIIDLSELGRNPMATPDGRYQIVYNGEVYNYRELRRELVAEGVPFRSETDTEVVLHLFARLGARCLDRLNGMFAFAIWDAVERRLFVARDRVGIKPLYYAEYAEGLAFASEAKALLLHPRITCDVNEAAIPTYMRFGYVPGETTMFRGIRKLPPGWSMTIDRKGVRASQYWDVAFEPNHRRTVADTARELRALLADATRIHMRSDVPVGVFLSGGLDSSTTVALLAEAGVENIQTFSVAYREGPQFDESEHARLVAERFHTHHRVLYVEPREFGAFVPDYVWHMDEPVTEAAAISLYFVSKLLREHVIVALSGEGADELFAGYDIYRYMLWIERYRRLPGWERTMVESAARRFGDDKVRKYARLAGKPLAERYTGVHLYDEQPATLFARSFAHEVDADPLAPFYARARGFDALSQMLYVDFKAWLVDDLLIKADKMTMANSVELRVPFLDYRVVEYAATVPSSMKLRAGTVKWILKEAVRDIVPHEIVGRAKVGFPTPLGSMFRGQLSSYVYDLLLSDRSLGRGYFDPAAVRALVDAHRAGRIGSPDLLWRLVVLEEWHRQFQDGHAAGMASVKTGSR